MARPIRVEYDGAVYHVTARGNDRCEIFRDDRDRHRYIDALEEGCGRFGMMVHAYCLMPNHYHLLIETPRGNLSQSVGWLQTTYSIRFNRRHGRCGHLLQGRFKAHLIEADTYARELVRYIHLNPVRPKDKRAVIPPGRRTRLDRHRWSSHRAYAGMDAAPDWLSLDYLGYWGRTRRRAHRAYVADVAGCFGASLPDPMRELRGGLVLGGDSLWEKVGSLLADASTQEEIYWTRRESQRSVRERVACLADGESDPRVRIWMRVRLGGERLVDVARDAGYRDGSGVLHVARRLEARARKDSDLAARLKRLSERLDVSSVKS